MDRRQPSSGQFRSRFDLQFNNPSNTGFNGRVALVTKREALRLARCTLKDSKITARVFNDALNSILTHSDKLKPWTQLVESAYERLSQRERPLARFFIMSFRAGRRDYEGVLRVMPKRFVGTFALVNLAYVMEAAFALDNEALVRKLAKRLPHSLEDADHPIMREHLRGCLSEFYERYGE